MSSSKDKYLYLIFFVIIGIYILINILYLLGPVIIVKGSNNIKLEVNTEYKEKGYNVLFFTNNLKNNVLISSNVNTSILGKYKVIYTLYDNNKTYEVTRKVNVVDTTKPVLELKDRKNSKACPNSTYIEQGYSAIDNYDGNLTDKVKITKKKKTWKYEITDSSGNTSIAYRNIIYEDKVEPIITLIGGDYTMYVGNNYEEKGYTAIDNCNGDITDKVVITNNVNINEVGEYIVKYEVADDVGNITSTERKVTVVNKPVFKSYTIYLTFDDGPSSLTNQYLDILKEENVKATFFINDKGRQYDDILRRIVDEGHVLANHTASHNFSYIYQSSENFWSDIDKVNILIKNITSKDNRIFRFPGGSSNTVSYYNRGIMTQLVNEANAKNYIYVDWTIDSNDAGGASSSTEVYNNVISTLGYQKLNIVLMHDGKYTTLGALRDIIKYGKEMGFNFAVIDETTPYAHHHINN